MAERPILFSAPMVRAILNGSKTQTRRVVKPQPPEWAKYPQEAMNGWEWTDRDVDTDDLSHWPDYYRPMRCPYGQPGDRLWVRETWREWGELSLHYAADGLVVPMLSDRKLAHYLAHRSPFTWHSYKWRPSIHMPRWASRITLEVTGVRVEKLGTISYKDAIAEGVSDVKEYKALWIKLNGDWSPEIWVWVVSFQRVLT